MTEKQALLILNAISGLGNRRIIRLIEYFGHAQNILKASFKELSKSLILPENVVQNITQFHSDAFLDEESKLIDKHQVEIIDFLDEKYPEPLRYIPDAPVLLYVKGAVPENWENYLAIVGSRKASVYGSSTARTFANRLAQRNINIVSGLAKGIDRAAHEGCLSGGGKTAAVIGSGLLNQYPQENRALYEKIEKSGCILSEFPMQTKPLAHHFPRRNRIISGLAKGVLVVEAAQRSGALITADFALEQGKEVYAIPGSIDRANSFGVHGLIKQGAKLVASIDDILEDFNETVSKDNQPQINSNLLSTEERSVFGYLKQRPYHLDEIMRVSGLNPSGVSSALLALELKKLIKPLPGKIYSKR